MIRSALLHSRRAGVAAALTSAAALAATAALALPASAASQVLLIGAHGDQAATCAAATHGVTTANWPISQLENGCGTRVWEHGDTGWTWCVSPHTDANVPGYAQLPINFQVTSTTAAC